VLSNYALERTDGTGFDVSWEDIGHRPFNAALGLMDDSTPVRVALKSDASMLAAVRAAADPATGPFDPDYFDSLVGQNQGQIYVAQSEGSVVGYLALQRAGHAAVAARNPIRLWQLYVAPPFHGSGVAGQLMNAALIDSRNQTHEVIWLGVSEHNDRAVAFYRKQGFVTIGSHLVGMAEHAHQDVVMSRAIA
jgi:ribosomal protein S18 acetylase RimI-like enzyme